MKLLKHLSELLFPPRCVFCHRILSQNDIICENCCATLPYRSKKDRVETLAHVDACVAPFHYQDEIRDAVKRYKFHSVTGNADIFARLMLECYEQELFGKTDLTTWVPVSRRRLRKRGYDQAEELAKAFGKLVGRAPLKTLNKIRHNNPQSLQKTYAGRRANVIGSYRIGKESVAGKSVLLIDDVVTSGSTVSECAYVLRAAGAKKVYVLAFAKTPKSKKGLKVVKNRV